MLYSVVTPEEKYKTKNFIDTAICRFGNVVGSFTNQFITGLRTSSVSIVMLPFAVLWAAVSISLGRVYRRQTRALKDSGVP
jgi:AAA family ATP:ADP antiporter